MKPIWRGEHCLKVNMRKSHCNSSMSNKPKFQGLFFLEKKIVCRKQLIKNTFVNNFLISSQLLKHTMEAVEPKVRVHPKNSKTPLKSF